MLRMTSDLTRLLTEHGVEVPALQPIGGSEVLGFPSAGEEALAHWRRLRAVSEHTGHWPLLMDDEIAACLGDVTPDVPDVAPLGAAGMDDRQRQELLDEWPDEFEREDVSFRVPFFRDGQPAPVLVALLPVRHGWQAPLALGYGDWNEYPAPAKHSAFLRGWHERYGVELVSMTCADVELVMTRPPRTRSAALDFAWEYCDYCADGVDVVYQVDGFVELAANFLGADVVLAWWD